MIDKIYRQELRIKNIHFKLLTASLFLSDIILVIGCLLPLFMTSQTPYIHTRHGQYFLLMTLLSNLLYLFKKRGFAVIAVQLNHFFILKDIELVGNWINLLNIGGWLILIGEVIVYTGIFIDFIGMISEDDYTGYFTT